MSPTPLGDDGRSAAEKAAWALVGPPLYYCEHCLLAVQVTSGESGPNIKRRCSHSTARIIAPRRAIVAGKGGLPPLRKLQAAAQIAIASATGRCF